MAAKAPHPDPVRVPHVAQVQDGRLINVSNVYAVAAGDTLDALGRRFGLGLADLLALNPDVDETNMDALQPGKALCVLARAAAYSRCAAAAEPANPAFFERIAGFDPRGVPVKAYNPRYPADPRPPSVNGG